MTHLNPNASYVLALTYASDHVYHRVQSLEANGVVLHGPYALPQAKATRVIVEVPQSVTREGKMTLSWKIHGEVNATVSIIELWANKPATNGLRFGSITGLPDGLQGQVLDLAYDPVVGAQVKVWARKQHERPCRYDRSRGNLHLQPQGDRAVCCRWPAAFSQPNITGRSGRDSVSATNLFFEPVHYRPLPAKTVGLAKNCLLLDGAWAINPAPTTYCPRAAAQRPRLGALQSAGPVAAAGLRCAAGQAGRRGQGVRASQGLGGRTASSCASTPSTPARATGSTATNWATARTCSRPSNGTSPMPRSRARPTGWTWR